MEILSIEDFYEESQSYVKLFVSFCEKHNLRNRVYADHICYKCGSRESFERIRTLFEPTRKYLYESTIGGRTIAYIRLMRPIDTFLWESPTLGEIKFLELSDQKPDGSQRDGFDHIEAYPLRYSPYFSYEEMIRVFGVSEVVKYVERPHHNTHDIDIGGGFLFRCTRGRLIDRIKNEQME